jgi:hypothetical protein
MKLSIRQVTYLLDQGVIKSQDFDTVAMRTEPFPSHLMLLQKAGLITWEAIEEYESNVNWSMAELLKESPKDQAVLDKYNFKFVAYLREQLASVKINGYQHLNIMWDKVEYDLPELVKFLYMKRLSKFGFQFRTKTVSESGNEIYTFLILNPNQDPNIYKF